MVNLHNLLPPKFNMEPENGEKGGLGTGGGFRFFFMFTPNLGEMISNLTNIFQMG